MSYRLWLICVVEMRSGCFAVRLAVNSLLHVQVLIAPFLNQSYDAAVKSTYFIHYYLKIVEQQFLCGIKQSLFDIILIGLQN